MEDDIDIEEHDLMDNPRIKNIFPLITNIKTEVVDFDYEDQQTYSDEAEEEFDDYPSDTPEDYVDYNSEPKAHSNKIILGSKPVRDTSNLHYKSSVILEDWGPILYSSPCYCAQCKTLFPTQNSLDFHKMRSHSFLIAVSNNKAKKSTAKIDMSFRNKAVKSTAKAALSFRNKAVKSTTKPPYFCNHCDTNFLNEMALLKHSYGLLPEKQIDDKPKICKKDEKATFLSCSVCTCYFFTLGSVMRHIHKHHGGMAHPTRIKFVNTCKVCNIAYPNKKSYNEHIRNIHSDYYYKKDTRFINNHNKCPLCNHVYLKPHAMKIHMARKHSIKKIDRKLKTDTASKAHPAKTPAKINDLSYQLSSQIQIPNAPVPKSVLFKCNKCEICSISSVVISEHAKQCKGNKGDWKCQKCRRFFKKCDIDLHKQQHEISARFKVYTFHENLTKKLFFKCPECELHFNEKAFWFHWKEGCDRNNRGVHCKVCKLKFNNNTFRVHSIWHFLKTDVISIDCVPLNGKNMNSKPKTKIIKSLKVVDKPESTESNPSKKGNGPIPPYSRYCCQKCKCIMHSLRGSDVHISGRCRQKRNIICVICGLSYTPKTIISHRKEHLEFDFNPANLMLKDIITKKYILVPAPKFYKCRTCKVHCFYRRGHSCNSETKMCSICTEKFTPSTYKIHMIFHERIAPLKIQSSTPYYVYLCKNCNFALDYYDKAVGHAQEGFCGLGINGATIQCKICAIDFDSSCYTRHKKIHATGVPKENFVVLKFAHDYLLTDDWFKVFNGVPQKEIELILSKSIYKDIRKVKLERFKDGSPDLTIYKCVQCRTAIDKELISEHVTKPCSKYKSCGKCESCTICFSSAKLYLDHLGKHNPGSGFTVILFNDKKNANMNHYLNKPDLKFIRCVPCGLLINKTEYDAHVAKHDKKKKYTFYQCEICNCGIFNKNNISSHSCLARVKTQCGICGMTVNNFAINKHKEMHKKLPSYVKKNIRVVIFNNTLKNDLPRKGLGVNIDKHTPKDAHNDQNIMKEEPEIDDTFNKIYRCVKCALLFTSTATLSGHKKECKTVIGINCNECGLSYHPSDVKQHKHGDDCVLISTKSDWNNKQWIYMCKRCNIYFLPINDIKRHIQSGHKREKVAQCDKCKLQFHKDSIDKHTSSNCNSKQCVQMYDHHETFQSFKDCLPKKEVDVAIKMDSDIKERGNVRKILKMHECAKCLKCWSNQRSLRSHILRGIHNFKAYNCEYCGLFVVSRVIKEHIHQHEQLKIDKINVYRMVKNKMVLHRNMPAVAFEKKDVTKSETVPLYACTICGKHMLTATALKVHVLNEYHDHNYNNCDYCNLVFTSPSYWLHVEFHDSKSVKNFAIHKLVDDAIVFDNLIPCATVPKTLFNQQPIPNDDKKVFNSASEVNTVEKPEAGETSQNLVVGKSMEGKQTKLYKCNACDVYYVTASSCIEHTKRHVTLDTTEYIACKICDLQFSICDSLGQHMKSHKEKTFNFDALIVEEYEADSDKPKDVYSAVDRFKSKVVSTTTLSDNEGDNKVDTTVDDTIEVSIISQETLGDSNIEYDSIDERTGDVSDSLNCTDCTDLIAPSENSDCATSFTNIENDANESVMKQDDIESDESIIEFTDSILRLDEMNDQNEDIEFNDSKEKENMEVDLACSNSYNDEVNIQFKHSENIIPDNADIDDMKELKDVKVESMSNRDNIIEIYDTDTDMSDSADVKLHPNP